MVFISTDFIIFRAEFRVLRAQHNYIESHSVAHFTIYMDDSVCISYATYCSDFILFVSVMRRVWLVDLLLSNLYLLYGPSEAHVWTQSCRHKICMRLIFKTFLLHLFISYSWWKIKTPGEDDAVIHSLASAFCWWHLY